MKRMIDYKEFKELEHKIKDLGDIVDVENNKIIVDEITSTENSIKASKPIIEDMTGYSYLQQTQTEPITIEDIYAGVVKNGNKLTFAFAFNLTRTGTLSGSFYPCAFRIPLDVANKLYPNEIGSYNLLSVGQTFVTADGYTGATITYQVEKSANLTDLFFRLTGSANMNSVLTQDVKFFVRLEVTFLLSDNLAI